MTLSPQMRERFRKFHRDKKAWFSFILLSLMFAASLPAELIFNDRPLILQVDGKNYYPFCFDYTMQDFGGESSIPITYYYDQSFMDFLNGIAEKNAAVDLFGDDDDDDDTDDSTAAETKAPATSAVKKHTYWFLWAPIRHSYKSKTLNPKTGRETLASPYRQYVAFENRWYESSWLDGHYLGTDSQGKDVLARLVYGFRISMFFGLGLAITGSLFGTCLGAIQGYFGGWVDLLGQRLTEIWGSMPQLFILIILSSFMAAHFSLTNAQHYLLLFGILNLTAWVGTAQYVRAEFLRARNQDYVKSARSLGVSDLAIMGRHILPNSLIPVITFLPFQVTGGILALASLDFLSLGVRYPAPSLGDLISQGQANLQAKWIILSVFILMTLLLTLLTFIGDGVRAAFDPKS